MSVTSNVQIHITTAGDVVMDEVFNCVENKNSPALILLQTIIPNTFVEITNPFLTLPTGKYAMTGFIVVPPGPDNAAPYSITHVPQAPILGYHPTNPSFFSIINWANLPLYLSHGNPTPMTYRFIWI
jgi:hypothetical protein